MISQLTTTLTKYVNKTVFLQIIKLNPVFFLISNIMSSHNPLTSGNIIAFSLALEVLFQVLDRPTSRYCVFRSRIRK